jgi:hypothetical protein
MLLSEAYDGRLCASAQKINAQALIMAFAFEKICTFQLVWKVHEPTISAPD